MTGQFADSYIMRGPMLVWIAEASGIAKKKSLNQDLVRYRSHHEVVLHPAR
jgi:hypothetical protein